MDLITRQNSTQSKPVGRMHQKQPKETYNLCTKNGLDAEFDGAHQIGLKISVDNAKFACRLGLVGCKAARLCPCEANTGYQGTRPGYRLDVSVPGYRILGMP
eukprot:1532019-Rhodomonas_salina.4